VLDELFRNVRTTFPHAALLLTLALIGASSSRAQFVVPISYSFSVAPNSDGNSYPDSGNELTDGVLSLNFNNYHSPAEAAAVTGWIGLAPSITFQFAAAQTFSRIEVGTSRWVVAGVVLPPSVTIAGSTFNLNVTALDPFPENTRGWLVFDGNFNTTIGSVLTIDFGNSGNWLMLDEVRFTAIAEPSTCAALFGLTALGFAGYRRRHRQTV
jgi:hypothetical protein